MKRSTNTNVLVLQLGSERPREKIRFPKNWKFKFLKALKFRALKFKTPVKNFDYVLISSRTTFRYLKQIPSTKKIICIGSRTAEGLRHLHPIVLGQSSSEGILKFFRRLTPASIYFPRSKRGSLELTRKLKGFGFDVTEQFAYNTVPLNLRRMLKPLFKANESHMRSFIILSSPSCWEALKKSLTRLELKNLKLRLIAIGPTTKRSIQADRFRCHMASKASLNSCIQVVKKLL